MSTPQTPPECQKLLSEVAKVLSPFEQEIYSGLADFTQPVPLHLSQEQLALFAAHFTLFHSSKLVIGAGNIEDLRHLAEAIKAWNTFWNLQHSWHVITDTLTEQEQTGIITTPTSIAYHTFLSSDNPTDHFLVTQNILTNDLPDKTEYRKNVLTLTVSEKRDVSTFIKRLVSIGYVRHKKTLEAGSIRVRGDVVDVMHPAQTGYITISFFGDRVERITWNTGRRSSTLESIRILPMKFPAAHTSWQTVTGSFLLIAPHDTLGLPSVASILYSSPNPRLTFPLRESAEEVVDVSSLPLYIAYQNLNRFQNIQEKTSQPTILCKTELAAIPTHFVSKDFEFKTEAFFFPESRTRAPSPISYERALELIGKLQVGKPAVHADHGIGIYEGLQRRHIDGIEREYLILRYAEGDALSVPVEFAHKITPYIGEATPRVYRLGGSAWVKTKKKAEEDAVAFAHELLTLAKKRTQSERTPYIISPDLERRLEETFPFELTLDQQQTWQEIIQDLRKPVPMDRLVVGDVGFGKTEMAIRAARHAVNNGKQVAVLAPTTLLVQQHFDTFQSRLGDISNKVHLLSRFISPKEQAQTRDVIRNGEAKVVVGTHALLSKKTVWKNLGLIIIDEEQRFGVKQKEHFKKIRASIDILSLSATPIPRTLSMALSGLRALSVITTAPEERKEVMTTVSKVHDDMLKKAVTTELNRGGQIYIVAPKIRQLAAIREHVQALFPKARLAIAHGQLPDETLSKLIHQFDSQEIDILISSSIVENGLDLPNANTMIVWHAPQFGLAELYQLRGRIGRRQRQGFAYFLYEQEELTLVQKERLTAITEASRLGAGWEVARRDMEMRGTGNLLGAEQSGSAHAVGLQLYLDMVHQQVEPHEEALQGDVDIQLPLSVAIPTTYIPDVDERTQWYQRLTRAKDISQFTTYKNRLQEQYGELPAEVENLLLILLLQRVAAQMGIRKITSRSITPPDEDPYARLELEVKSVLPVLERVGQLGNWVARGTKLTWDVDAITPELIRRLTDKLS